MPNKTILVIAYFIVLMIISFVIYAKLCNYMYMAAGVKKKDVQKFSRENVVDSQRRLVRWLRDRADNSKEFNTIFFFCNAISATLFINPTIIFMIVVLKLDFNVVKIIMLVEAVAMVLLAVFGFIKGKRIEEQREIYFQSSEYKPYEGEDVPDYIDDLDELYNDLKEDETHIEVDSDERAKKEQKVKILRYAIKIIIVIVALMFLFSPIIFKNVRFNFINNNYNENSYGQNEYVEENAEEIPKDVNITLVRNKVEEAGFNIGALLEEREKEYPNYNFEDEFCVDEYEMYIEYIKMVDSKDSLNLYYDLQDEFIEKFGADDDNVTEENRTGLNLHAIENHKGYAILIRDDDSVIYAHCDEVQTTWLKCLMYELGYLETF